MSFLLDTNVLSEGMRPRPNRGVVAWLAQVDEDRVFISVITMAELRRGIVRLPVSSRKAKLHRWLAEELRERFAGRILPIDDAVAMEWGDLVAARETAGGPIQPMDALIAATARVYDLAVVTRNVRDFKGAAQATINPWQPE